MTITFRAADVPGVGYRSYLVRPSVAAPERAGSRPATATTVENAALLVRADPARGGTLAEILDKRTGTELLSAAGGGNELLLQPEHPAHPRWAEGPWLLCPAGPPDGAAWPSRCRHRRAVPGRQPADGAVRARRAARHPGDRAVGRRRPGRVPHPRRRLDRARPPAAGRLPGQCAGRPAGVPDRGLGDRPRARRHRHRRRRAPLHAGHSGERVVRRRFHRAREPSGWRRRPPAAGHRRRRGGLPGCAARGRAGPAGGAGPAGRHRDLLGPGRDEVRLLGAGL